MNRAFALVIALALAGCGDSSQDRADTSEEIPDVAVSKTSPDIVGDSIGTPMKDRVATIGLLNKRNNLTQDLVLKSGQSKRVGNVVVKVEACERTRPWETTEEEGAFVQVFVEERASARDDLAWHKVFSGWLFKNSPSLNVVEHPVYDVWVKDCAMSFPGEEDSPAASASDSNEENPSGSDN